jgi:hypothetical protein
MGTQLYAALLNKARRSELAIRLLVGYDRGEYEARSEPNTLSAIEDRAEELGRLSGNWSAELFTT